MVVIRNNRSLLLEQFGELRLERLESFSDVIGYTLESEDEELVIELNPDRPDLLSFATLIDASEQFLNPQEFRNFKLDNKISFLLERDALKLRPFMYAFIAEGSALGPNFEELINYQEKIHATVGKNRQKASIGIHDLSKISLPARFVSADSDSLEFTTYDGLISGSARSILEKHPKGIEFSHLIKSETHVPVILDSEDRVLSLPPVINGLKSVVNANSSSFFVDITGTDSNACISSMFLLMNFMEVIGYKTRVAMIGSSNSSYQKNIEKRLTRNIKIDRKEVDEFIGLNVKGNQFRTSLQKMGYEPNNTDFPFQVKVPAYRADVMGPADILEDLAKAIGYSNIEPRRLIVGTVAHRNEKMEFANLVKDMLLGSGFQEILSFVVGSDQEYNLIEYKGKVRVLNPKSQDFSVVRDRLSLNSLRFYQNNRNRSYPQNVFEVGNVISDGGEETRIMVSMASSRVSFSDLKRVVEYLIMRLIGGSFSFEHSDSEMFIPGRSADILVDNVTLGVMGEVLPDMLEHFSLKVPVVIAEMSLDTLYTLYLKYDNRKL